MARGEQLRIAHCIYLPAVTWRELDVDQRFRAVVHAAALRYPHEVFSHLSAAALWRMPSTEPWPTLAQALVVKASGGRSRRGLVRHATHTRSDVVVVDGVRVTGLAATVVDVAMAAVMTQAVAIADRALGTPERAAAGLDAVRTSRDELWREGYARARVVPARCRRVLEFADGRSGSAGESVSRVAIRMLGFADPELQWEFVDRKGSIGRVDFWWPDSGVVGEFDGHGKYLNATLRAGRSVAEVIVDEKRREDRLRACPNVRTVTRWEWRDARTLRLLDAQLRAAGVARRR
ncbi:hypothetical protein BH09ACT4_BH09ACT4_18670 [soil metagenome]